MKQSTVLKLVRKTVFLSGILLIHMLAGFLQAQADLSDWKSRFQRTPHLSGTMDEDPAAFDVLHYRFDLTFPFESSAFFGTVTLTCSALETLESLTLQMADLTADSIYLEDLPVSYSHSYQTLHLDLPQVMTAGSQFRLTIAYHGAPDDIGFIFYDRCAYTMAEPEEARYWFPCHDVPWDKATAELHVTVPKGVEVASIGLLKDRTISQDDAWETFYWETGYPVATYLICLTMSDEYTVWSDWFVTSGGDSIEMPYYVFNEDAEKAPIDVENMPAAMSFFCDVFGEYPFEKYGTATVTKAWFGGMEHQTMTTVVQSWWRGDKSYENGFVHELAHMWWGDAVTLNEWPAIWLNEGFATYSDILFREWFYGTGVMRSTLQEWKQVYINQAANFDFPIYNPPRESLFDWGIVYIKGGWILHMLRHVVGEAKFWAILSDYYETYRYGNASIPDFQSVCEHHYGRPLAWFFDAWIYGAGYMELAYDWKNVQRNDSKYDIRLKIEQRGTPFQMPLDIRMHTAENSSDTTVWIDGSYGLFRFVMSDSVQNIVLDPDGWLLMSDSLQRIISFPDPVLKPVLFNGFPNPFQESVTIAYQLPEGGSDPAEIRVIDLNGRQICRLAEGGRKNDRYEVIWNGLTADGQPAASGVYFFVLHTGSGQSVQKIVRIQ